MFADSHPYVQGFNGTTPIQYLRSQFLNGSVSNGSATVYLTDDLTQTGNPMFSAIHHVTVTTYLTTGDTWSASQSLSTDLKTFTFDVLENNAAGAVFKTTSAPTYTVAVFGEP
jgi:hypothetical protein